MKKSILVGMTAAVLATASAVATSADLIPSLAGMAIGEQRAGEGALLNLFTAPPTQAIQHVDWIVRRDSLLSFSYYFQLENGSIANLDVFTINSGLGFITPGSVSCLGASAFCVPLSVATDLDLGFVDPITGAAILPHDTVSFPNLAPLTVHPTAPGTESGETENSASVAGNPAFVCCSDDISGITLAENVSWTFDPPLGNVGTTESTVLFFRGTNPIYVNASTQNGSQWANNKLGGNPGGEPGRPVPAPGPQQVPEPASLLLLGVGLGGLGFWMRRRRQS